MTDASPYATPAANLVHAGQAGGGGNLQDAISGNYRLDFGEVLSKAWTLTKGSKLLFFMSMVIIYVVMFAAMFVLGLLGLGGSAMAAEGDFVKAIVTNSLVGFLIIPLMVPLYAGMMMIAVKRAARVDTGIGELFAYYGRIVPLTLTNLLMTVLIYVGMILLVLPGIYLAIAYMCAIPLVVEKNLGIWQALETSRKALTHSWFTIFGVFFVGAIIAGVSAIPLGIGLIWTLPWLMLMLGVIYYTIFGYGGAAAEPAA